jgi:hypothetical protein
VSILKPEGSVMAGIAVAGTVFATYNLSVGNISAVHMTSPNDASLESARKKAGYVSFILVSALLLITRDGNVGALGYASIVAMEATYRHSIMADPATGKIVPPAESSYQPAAQNTVALQGVAA